MFYKKFLAYLNLGLGVLIAVNHVEQIIHPAAGGSAKLQLVTNIATQAVSATPEIADHIKAGDIAGAVDSIASPSVSILKLAGVFKSSPGASLSANLGTGK